MTNQQPIETAPRDGTHILAWDRIKEVYVKVKFCKSGAGVWVDAETEYNRTTDEENVYTHWVRCDDS